MDCIPDDAGGGARNDCDTHVTSPPNAVAVTGSIHHHPSLSVSHIAVSALSATDPKFGCDLSQTIVAKIIFFYIKTIVNF